MLNDCGCSKMKLGGTTDILSFLVFFFSFSWLLPYLFLSSVYGAKIYLL